MKYPTWKKVTWEAGRTFVQAFLASFGFVLMGANGLGILKDGASIGFIVFLQNLWGVIVYPGLLAGIAAGISAVGKYSREKFGKGDYKKAVYKLPI